jgi:hypothetical protein
MLEHTPDSSPVLTSPSPHAAPTPGRSTATARLAPRTVLYLMRGDAAPAVDAEHAVDAATGDGGRPLPSAARERFEGGLGVDLGGVRVHTGDASATAARAIGARAYTQGQDIHFAEGQYNPDDPFGLHLLAHEVAHTVQQRGGTAQAGLPQTKLEVSMPGDRCEAEADAVADALVAGRSAAIDGVAPTTARQIMRKPSVATGGKHVIEAPPIKVPPLPLGYAKLNGAFKLAIEFEDAPDPAADPANEPGAEAKGGAKNAGLEGEIKVKLAEDIRDTKWSASGGAKAGIDFHKKAIEVTGVLAMENKAGKYPVEVKLEPILFKWSKDGIEALAVKASGELAIKQVTVPTSRGPIQCTLKPAFEAELEPDKAKIASMVMEKIVARVGGTALVNSAMVANGALMLFQYFDAIVASADIKQLTAQGVAATAKARALINETSTAIANGQDAGGLLAHLTKDLQAELGDVPPEMIAAALKQALSPEALRQKLWTPMRAQVISRCLAEYRGRHKTESAFYDFGKGVGKLLGDERANEKNVSWGQDALAASLEASLPTSI